MKRNNVAKKIGIASLCLATAISAFSGISSFKNDSVALAEAQVEDWVTVTQGAATAGVETRDVYDTNSATLAKSQPCLRISSEAAYEATFNRIFQNNTQLRFAFPDTAPSGATKTFYGDFKFRVTDAADENNFFDIVYTTTEKSTTMYVEWNGNTLQAYVCGTITNELVNTYKYNSIVTNSNYYRVSPSFMQAAGNWNGKREGLLKLSWDTAGVLSVSTNRPYSSGNTKTAIVAKFDGTYDSTKGATNNFSNKTRWGLPKMTFPNGYKISFSSSYTNPNAGATDNATDVSFWQIANDGTTYTFGDTAAAGIGNNYMQAYDLMEANAGKTLLGWKNAEDAENALYSTATALKSADISVYTPVFLGFDKIYGASIRVVTSGNDESGLRFITGFETTKEELEAATYITEFGTLVAYTGNLTEGIFDTVNYATAISAGTKVKQVANGSNGGSTFDYAYGGKTYRAYSVALVGLTNYTQKYSARGYMVVTYAGGTTATFYTPYIAKDDTRSIAQTAYNLKNKGVEEYNKYSPEQQTFIDGYIPANFVPEE